MREVHPYAGLFPAMSAHEYAELLASICASGVREPITLHRDGRVLDGRQRQRACDELGIEPAVWTFEGTDAEALQLVLDLNLNRRHLNESQRAMIAADLATMRQGARTDLASIGAMSQAGAADRMNASRTSTQRAVIVRDHAIPEIVAAVRQGQMPVSQAVRIALLPWPRQQQVAAQLGNGRSVSTVVLSVARAERVIEIERRSLARPLSALGRVFPVLYGDPPWEFEAWSGGGIRKAAEMHYPTMSVDAIAALPMGEIAARDAVLFLWAVPAMFNAALTVLRGWGFEYKTFAVWVKPNIGCGYWFRGQHEPLIVATRGNMPPPPDLHSSVFYGEASGRHSAKPGCVRDWIASAYPDAGRIELFAREAVPGWTCWGHEAA